MNMSPIDEVAVKARPPAATAPTAALRAEFSPSTSTVSASRRPSARNL